MLSEYRFAVYGLDINPRAIKISWIQLYLNALDESFSTLFRHCHCKRSFVLMVICGAMKEGQPVYDAVKKTLLDRVEFDESDLLAYC